LREVIVSNPNQRLFCTDTLGGQARVVTLQQVLDMRAAGEKFFLEGFSTDCIAEDMAMMPPPTMISPRYYIYDHLGNARVIYYCGIVTGCGATTYNLEFVADYSPYGRVLRSWIAGGASERYLTTQHERDGETGYDNRGARLYDSELGRFLTLDPLATKYYGWSPYNYVLGNPVAFIDPDGKDAIVTIKGNVITISTTIYIYGDGATAAVASQYKSDIDAKWSKQSSGANWTYTDSETGVTYDVVFDTKVDLYEGKSKSSPFIIPESWDPYNTDNFIEVSASTDRSKVTLGDEGEWRSQGRGGATLAADDPAPHEFGHLLGLDDRYTDKKGPDPGWLGNIMANSITGTVEQKNINGIVGDSVKELNKATKNGFDATKNEYKTKIDIAFPSN
jgi:RHS repeat-associated protein